MRAPTTVVTTKGQIVIPATIRKRHKIKKGTKLYVEERGDELILRPVTMEFFDKIAGILKTKGKLSKAILASRKADKKREEDE